MQESRSNEVVIRDADPEVVNAMLEFAYTRSSPLLAFIEPVPASFFQMWKQEQIANAGPKKISRSEHMQAWTSLGLEAWDTISKRHKDAFDLYKSSVEQKCAELIPLLTFASMYEVRDLVKECSRHFLLPGQTLSPRFVAPLARSLRIYRHEDGFTEMWKKLHKLVAQDADAFAALCEAI